MVKVSGFLTLPNLEREKFLKRVESFKKEFNNDNLETKLFDKGIRYGRYIGPNGVFVFGELNSHKIASSEIMNFFYENNIPKIPGLSYDISSSDSDFEVIPPNFNLYSLFYNYISVRVKYNTEIEKERILDFKNYYLNKDTFLLRYKFFRFVEPNYVAFEYLTDNLNKGFSKYLLYREIIYLKKNNLNVDLKKTVFLFELH